LRWGGKTLPRSIGERIYPAWLAEVDARAAASGQVFARDVGGSPVNVTMTAAAGFFLDAHAFLYGYGSEAGRDLTADGDASWSGFSVTVTGADRIRLEGPTAFDLLASADNAAFGFPTAGASAVLVGAVYRLDATTDWTRGLIEQTHLQIDPAGATPAFYVPSVPYRAQSVIALIRPATIGDSDAAWRQDCVQAVDNNHIDGGARRIRHGLTDDGRWWTAWPAGLVPAVGAPAWLSTDASEWARPFLGAVGDEVAATVAGPVGDLLVFEGPYPVEGVQHPTRSYSTMEATIHDDTGTLRTTGGEIAVMQRMHRISWVVEWYLDGPADTRNEHTHYMRRFGRHVPRGGRLTFMPDRHEPRRRRDVHEIARPGLGADVEAYDLSCTTEDDGRRGRFVCRRGIDDGAETAIRWSGSRARRRARITTLLEEGEAT